METALVKKFDRIKQFGEPWDKRDPDPAKNYGIHGVDIRFVLKGAKGAVQLVIYTNKQLPAVQEELLEQYSMPKNIKEGLLKWAEPFTPGKEIDELRGFQMWLDEVGDFNHKFLFAPLPADIGYHSPKPMFEGHEAMGSKRRTGEHEFIALGTNPDGTDKMVEMPIYEDTPPNEIPNCEYLGCPCYYDGSSLQAEEYYKILATFGEEALWTALEDYYNNRFETEENES